MATALNIGVNVASHAYLESKVVKESRVLIADLFRHFYSLGRVSGTSGLYHHSGNGSILSAPSPNPYPYKSLKCSNCAPLFMKVRGAMSAPLKSGLKSSSHNSEPLPRCILLDIEGTTTPITFVFDVLFPYARDNVGKHLSATYETEDTRADIKLLRSQVEDDLAQGVKGAVPIPPDDAGKDAVIAALVANIEAMIKADRKITALKQLQGHIWRTGFQNNELKGVVYDDVPEALKSWHALGIKMYIYSSGSRLAQRLIFGNTTAGDLRQFLSGFFDTNVGTKRESSSYIQISESLGVDNPSEILFLTDVVQEAVAAKAAGLKAVISVRPGNAPLPENHGFETINSFLEV